MLGVGGGGGRLAASAQLPSLVLTALACCVWPAAERDAVAHAEGGRDSRPDVRRESGLDRILGAGRAPRPASIWTGSRSYSQCCQTAPPPHSVTLAGSLGKWERVFAALIVLGCVQAREVVVPVDLSGWGGGDKFLRAVLSYPTAGGGSEQITADGTRTVPSAFAAVRH